MTSPRESDRDRAADEYVRSEPFGPNGDRLVCFARKDFIAGWDAALTSPAVAALVEALTWYAEYEADCDKTLLPAGMFKPVTIAREALALLRSVVG